MSDLKKQLYREVEIKNALRVDGISADPRIFKNLDLGGKYQEQIHSLSERDHETHVGFDFPAGFSSPNGFYIGFRWDRRSPYSLEYDGGRYYLAHQGEELFPVEFFERPKWYSLRTSDGTEMSHVATYNQEGCLGIAYSNECSLKEQNLDCLFCNINATKDTYAEKEGLNWKNPKQIGETVAAAFKEGARKVNLTGGFVPERREIDYYLDVAEAIIEHTGQKSFNGTAVIGAPLDLGVIDKYKEAGWQNIALNIEIWDKNIFQAIAPGKVIHCGGWDHWVKALEYAAQVFGRGHVRSNIVAGIEPKQSILEGVEYLASKGVVCFANPWQPNPGSALEGHRSPDANWHFDLSKKVAAIYRKAGFTYKNLYDVAGAPVSIPHDIYKIEDELLPVFKNQKVEAQVS